MSSSISIDLMILLRKHICEPQNLHLLLLMVQKLVLIGCISIIGQGYCLVLIGCISIIGQGIPGAYSEAAALKAYPKSETVPFEQFQAAFKALAQCEMMLSKLGIIRVGADDTAGAAQMVASSGERDNGAVASARAAKIYGPDVLAEKIQDMFA